MKRIEIRRHSIRDIPEEHLSVPGVSLASEVGRSRGPFRWVVASPAVRAVETAQAMGFPVNTVRESWHDTRGLEWPLSFGEYHALTSVSSTAREVARTISEEISDLLGRLSEDQQALVVTHGGFPEMAVAATSPREVAERLGPPCRCMEGVLLSFRRDACVQADALRVPAERTRI